MTDTSDLSPRQQRLREVSGAETGMHTLPGVAPPAAFDDGDQFGPWATGHDGPQVHP
jgi:hypothetical protein